jgi:catechol 2,3-dioxygenase-like lactoylglutathione lyase family enzyme
MAITGMNHFNILTDDVDGTVEFYRNVVGLEPGPRPDLGFPGAWMYAQGKAILHISGGRPKDQLKPGVIDHMAFSARGLSDALARLDERGIHYAHRRQAGAGTWQVFFFDPNGARVELDFDASEAEPERASAADRSVLPS